MALLILGVALFTLLHLVPIFATETRASVVSRISENGYKALYSLATFSAFYFIYKGWTLSEVTFLYSPPSWSPHATALLVLIGFVLFFSSRAPTNIKRYIRHPQLAGLACWAAGHLLSNGETRSVILFAGLGVWSVIAMLGSNRRDGEWIKPESQSLAKDIVTIVIGLALYIGFAFWAHEFLFGMRPFP
ncbi:MAG: NnrU family protein [Alphaproteobacteria bacterium]|nr:NnrU family protein [Alphaproteobacteria bacterium]